MLARPIEQLPRGRERRRDLASPVVALAAISLQQHGAADAPVRPDHIGQRAGQRLRIGHVSRPRANLRVIVDA